MVDGPVEWGRPARHAGPAVFLVETSAPIASPNLDLAAIGKWLERVPDLRLDGRRPTSRELSDRLRSFWLPSQRIVLIGSSSGNLAARLNGMAKTVPGDRKPAWTGFWLHFLRDASLKVWWATTSDAESTELAEMELTAAFAKGVPADEAAAMRAGSAVLPWASLQAAGGLRKTTGIANPLLPEAPAAPAPKPVKRIVELPVAEADGARDEAKRPRRPAPGRGAGRVASAAAYAAQGSPRQAAEQVILSPEGLERLQGELAELIAQRPDVIKRIATAREHGDLKENAEYHAAREEQGFLEGKIKQIEGKLKVAVVRSATERGQHVEMGSRVRVECEGEEQVFTLVSPAEASSKAGRISTASPVGAALVGRQVGDAVTIITPGGSVRYAILEIS